MPDSIAFRIYAGRPVALIVCRYAEMSSAASPVVIGDAIEVPWIISYPGPTWYGRTPKPPANEFSDMFDAGHVESSAPGATTFGFRPPSSRGPRDENVQSVSFFDTWTP